MLLTTGPHPQSAIQFLHPINRLRKIRQNYAYTGFFKYEIKIVRYLNFLRIYKIYVLQYFCTG